jgi:uncharacterized protein (DUF433 family)
MVTELIYDRGRGPEIVGTRITVYNLLPHFLDPDTTEADIGHLYELEPRQVAAARAFILNNLESVLGDHLRIEARMAAGNPPEVIERAKQTRSTFLRFQEWLSRRDEAASRDQADDSTSERVRGDSEQFPTFKEWLIQRESMPKAGA